MTAKATVTVADTDLQAQTKEKGYCSSSPVSKTATDLKTQAICEAHVDISCSQERRVVAQFAKKLQKSLCSVLQTALPDRFPNISSAAQYYDSIV
ncbi:hypothetical protein T12_11326 [Trichinella patagoniensis]|uniref:Uncharacterized protein n=1 Tax=Trichinella patagoniensis TaxID=990121 RepID=A0A0V0Z7B4_9BILA|nr:hypothetical protein T12_11326 [Trichinella patagoniensis]